MQTRSRKASKGILKKLQGAGRPTPQQAGIVALLVVVIALVGLRVVDLVGEFREVRAARQNLEAKRASLEERHRDLEQQARFVADPDHLEQELRSRFNYKSPGENVIIVVPPKATSSTTTDE